MRTIKFKAICINDKKWVESMTIAKGTIKRKLGSYYLEVAENVWKGVIPETICEFTGVLDANGKEIFEGDIVQCGTVGVIKFEEGRFFYDYTHPEDPEQLDLCEIKTGVVIGNIHNHLSDGKEIV